MKKKTLIVVFVIFGFASQGIFAEEMKFPKSEAEFVDALSIKKPAGLPANTRGLPRGLDTRGLGGITEPSTPLKVGALINFDYDSDNIKPESCDLLDSFGSALKGGLSDTRLVVQGYGESTPIADNQTPEGRSMNRRVEFIRE